MIADEMTQFWKIFVQDDQLEKLAKKAWEAKAQLMTLNTLLHTIPLMVYITCFEEFVGHPICKLITANIQSVKYLLLTQGSILFQG